MLRFKTGGFHMMQMFFKINPLRGRLFFTKCLLAVTVASLLSGCKPSDSPGSEMPEDHVFFDLREFFGNEAKYLEKHMSNPQKTVRLNGQESVLASPDLDYTEELAPFINSDINKPSWKDKYQVDSIFSGTRLTGVRYVAVDDALKTRELQLSLSDGEVERVWIRNSIHSIISRSDQELRYNRQEGYAIEGRQSGRFFGEKHFSVEVEF